MEESGGGLQSMGPQGSDTTSHAHTLEQAAWCAGGQTEAMLGDAEAARGDRDGPGEVRKGPGSLVSRRPRASLA